MQIDFLIGDNPYGTTPFFAKSLAAAMERLGYRTRLFWVADYHFFHALNEIHAQPPQLTCSFSDIHVQGKPLGEMLRIPHLSLLIDPAIYFLHQLKSEKYGWVSCVDQDDCKWLQEGGFKNSFFLPHGAETALLTPVDKKRPFDAVFFGTCIDYQAIEKSWEKRYAKHARVLREAAERVLAPAGISILNALLSLNVAMAEIPLLHREVDQYIRGKDRVELLKKISTSHTLHIWGRGPWKKYVPDATLHRPLPFEKTFSIMQNAQLVLNSSPRFKSGTHERMFYASICGACVLTGENHFVNQHFIPGIDLLTYRFGEWEVNTRPTQEIALKGQQKVLQHHTWDTSATLLHHWLLTRQSSAL